MTATSLVFSLIAGGVIVAAVAADTQRARSEPARFIASPTSGSAPLLVKFCASAGIAINFGDGAGSGLGAPPRGVCPSEAPMYATHVYTAPGIYRLVGSPCPSASGGDVCGEVAQQASAVTIVVTPRR